MKSLLVGACVALAACQGVGGGAAPPPTGTTLATPTGPVKLRLKKHYVDGADGLQEMWLDIVRAAKKDERDDVHDLMASLIMSDSDMEELFGAERAKYLAPRYAPMISRLVNAGAMELIAEILEKKYDDVEVFAVHADGTPQERATLAALPTGTAVFGVRVKHKGEANGPRLRYDFFVYRHGRWVTGNLMARYLVADAADAGAR